MGTLPCKACEEGNKPEVLDVNGVQSSISGKPGCWAHAHEGDWRFCERKAAEEYAIVAAIDQLSRSEGEVLCIGRRREAAGTLTCSVIVAGAWCSNYSHVFRGDTLAEALANAVAAREAAEQEAS